MNVDAHDLRRVAIHEAAHAVIGRVLGLKCGFVTINADHNSAGHSMIADPYATWDLWDRTGKHRSLESAMRGRILALMAGREADEDFHGPSEDHGDAEDVDMINEMLDSGEFYLPTNADFREYERRLRMWARVLVRRHRQTIERFADELQLRGKMTRRQADRFVVKLYRPRVRRMTSEMDKLVARMRRDADARGRAQARQQNG